MRNMIGMVLGKSSVRGTVKERSDTRENALQEEQLKDQDWRNAVGEAQ